MSLLDEENAQGSLEYLLLLAGIILFVAIIGFFLKNLARERLAGEVNQKVNQTAGGF